MPNYRIHVKLEGKPLKEYVVYSAINEIDYIFNYYWQRVKSKNGTGRVEYFDLVMIAEKSLKFQADREEVFNPENNFRISSVTRTKKKKEKRGIPSNFTLGDRNK